MVNLGYLLFCGVPFLQTNRLMTLTPGHCTRDVLIFTSPKAGTGIGQGRVAALAAILESKGVKVEITASLADLKRRTTSDSTNTPDMVVAAGGDGTLALVAQSTSARTVIAPMPTGTENLLAKQYGVSSNVVPMIDMIMAGRTVDIDAGLANGRLFLIMATCGFDAEVVRAMHLTRRGHINRFSYLGPTIRAIRRYQFPELSVAVTYQSPLGEAGHASLPAAISVGSGTTAVAEAAPSSITVAQPASIERVIPCRWAMVFNLPRYAVGLGIESSACGDDGELDLCALQRGSVWGGLRYLAGVIAQCHGQWPDVIRQRIIGCEITSSSPVAYQIDGDYAGKLPLKIGVLPGRVRLRLPRLAG